MTGYHKNPEGTSAVLGPDGWLRTGDLAYSDEDGYVFIVGRAKELIIKGGMNIAPRQIDDVLVSHPAVLDAAALGVPDHHFGEDIVAFVNSSRAHRPTHNRFLTSVKAGWVASKHPPTSILSPIYPRARWARSSGLGWVSGSRRSSRSIPAQRRRMVPSRATGEVESDSDVLSPRTPIEEIIAETWAGMLEIPSPRRQSEFLRFGGHSLQAIEILCRLRKQFSVGLSINDFFTKPTVAQQAALVSERLNGDGEADGNPSGLDR